MGSLLTLDNILRLVIVANCYVLIYILSIWRYIRRVENDRDKSNQEAGRLQSKVWELERALKVAKSSLPEIKLENPMIKVGDRFRHFKTAGFYKVTALFTWEPTKEPAVLYTSEASGESWGRTLSVFLEEVANPKHPDQKVRRFEPLADDAPATFCSYHLEQKQDEKGSVYFEVYNAIGEPVATLKDGIAPLIAMSFVNMAGVSQVRGDDYMAGVINGCTHMTLLQSISTSGARSQCQPSESTNA